MRWRPGCFGSCSGLDRAGGHDGRGGSHAYSQGAGVWVIIDETLLNAVRAAGSAIVCFLIWMLCAGISLSFPVVAAKSGAYAFGFFAAHDGHPVLRAAEGFA